MKAGFAIRRAAFALTLALSACGGDTRTNDGFPVTEAGPFEVGYRILTTTYDPQDGTGPRTIRVSIWYPSVDDAADRSPDGHAYTYLLRETNAFLNAPLRPTVYRDGYPVIVHSHGDSGYADQNFHAAEGYARHGFVVVAPMHEGNTAFDIAAGLRPLSVNYTRPMDVTASLDLIESGLPASDPLYHRCVTDRVIASGHSRGTETVIALLGAPVSRAFRESECASGAYDTSGGCPAEQLARFDVSYHEPRIVAAQLQDGDGGPAAFVGGVSAIAALTTPLFLMTGTDDGAYPGVTALYPALVYEASLAVFEGGCHNLPAGGGCAGLTDTEAWPVVDAIDRAFARRHLFDDTRDELTQILDGTSSLGAFVTIQGHLP